MKILYDVVSGQFPKLGFIVVLHTKQCGIRDLKENNRPRTLTLNEAFKALEKAIISAYENQNRLLLVITGKGRNSVLGSGALKRELPHWLSLSHIASKIIRASNAAPKDGGDGAFYILIKRLKS